MTPRLRGWIALSGVLLLAALLRLLWLDAGWLGADQARDLTWGQSIVRDGNFPEFGPAMRNQLRLGPLYYWFWSTAYFFSQDLLAPYVFAAGLGVLAVAICWRLGTNLGGNQAGLLGALWLATAPIAVMNSRVAWAPAAIPALVAGFLWLARRLEAKPTGRLLASLSFLVAFGTQLHLSAIVLVPVLLLLFRRVPELHRKGVVGGALAAACLPILPMISANLVTIPFASPTALSQGSPYDGRWTAILLHGSRVLEAYLPPWEGLPSLIRLWVSLEGISLAVVLLAAGAVFYRVRREAAFAAPRVVLDTFFAGLLFAGLLPAEGWYYYLDTTLVPGALLVGLAGSDPSLWRGFRLPLVFWSLARSLGLIWWIYLAHASGNIFVQLDLLRLGGGSGESAKMQARVPTVAAKQKAFAILGEEFGITRERLFEDVHGWGFGDLVADNGFFATSGADRATDSGNAAVVVQHGDLPAAWVSGMRAATAGSLWLLAYQPTLDRERAQVVGCAATTELPERVRLHPRRYGSGEVARQVWPCSSSQIVVPIHPQSSGRSLRVLARIAGAGRVLGIESVPPGKPLEAGLPAGSLGLQLPPGASELQVWIETNGPADLDLLELHGAELGEGAGPW
jgi:hypothetical protein